METRSHAFSSVSSGTAQVLVFFVLGRAIECSRLCKVWSALAIKSRESASAGSGDFLVVVGCVTVTSFMAQ